MVSIMRRRYSRMKFLAALVVRSITGVLSALACTHCVSTNDDLPAGTATEAEALTAFAPVMCPNGPIDCQGVSAAGRCADKQNPMCDTSTNECVYRLNINVVGCVCIENTARVCDLGGGIKGVKRCELAGPVGTRWSACQAL